MLHKQVIGQTITFIKGIVLKINNFPKLYIMILAGLETFSQNLRIKYEVTANYREQQIFLITIFLITILKSTFVTSEVRCLSPREGLIQKRRVYFNYTMTYTPQGNAVEKGVTMSIYPF